LAFICLDPLFVDHAGRIYPFPEPIDSL
jgi:hypothetical protein